MKNHKSLWRSILLVKAVILLATTITSCASVSPKKRKKPKIELWLIDKDEVGLYRKLKNGYDNFLPIKSNPDMDRFMCFDKRSFLKSRLQEIEDTGK